MLISLHRVLVYFFYWFGRNFISDTMFYRDEYFVCWLALGAGRHVFEIKDLENGAVPDIS